VVIAVICPSRGNPKALFEAAMSFHDTRMGESTFVAVLDENDPKLGEYAEAMEDVKHDLIVVPVDAAGNMNLALNYAAMQLKGDAEVLGFIGDDHRFRTKGWDRTIAKVLSEQGGGFVYGNDLYMGDYLPTQVFISADIVRSLGWMGLPGARHLYLDNTWKYLGDATDSLYYLPDIVIEHVHPAAGKAEWDENHLRVNTNEMYAHDREVYEGWLRSTAGTDIERVKDVLSAHVA
jgi:hypothetical protein